MNSTVIITISDDNQDIAKSVDSVLNNTQKPTNVCIVASKNASNKTKGIIKALFKSCCDSEPYTEDCNQNYELATKKLHSINFHYLIVNDITAKTLLEYAVEYLLEETDIFFTLSGGNEYKINAIQVFLDSLKDESVGLSYSDYIENSKYIFLGSISSSLIYPSNNNKYNFNIKEICFRKKYIADSESLINLKSTIGIINILYGRSIIKHIPEALFTT